MNIKNIIRNKAQRFLGVSQLERQISDLDSQINHQANSDLVRQVEIKVLSSTADFIEQHMQNAKALSTNLEVLDYALSKISKDGLYCEFGVFRGTTINHIARQIKSNIYGFDSFEGLPEFWKEGFPKGAFNLNTDDLPKCEANVELIVGWFDQTLPPFAHSHPQPLVFLHVDCDLYSSTQTVFNIIGDRLMQGSVIVFDEYFNYLGWQKHEHMAFTEFIEKTGLSYEYICYNRHGEQVAVQIL